jgi:hypothetical protein
MLTIGDHVGFSQYDEEKVTYFWFNLARYETQQLNDQLLENGEEFVLGNLCRLDKGGERAMRSGKSRCLQAAATTNPPP